MNAGRRASDWLNDAPRPDRERRDSERRGNDRRAPRRSIDTLFAASLINQIRPAHELLAANPYRARAGGGAGALANVRA